MVSMLVVCSLFSWAGYPLIVHSFPTRRSSDLVTGKLSPERLRALALEVQDESVARATRSEEHTSELQSRVDLVCRLLLEKKKALHTTAPRPRQRRRTRAGPTCALARTRLAAML